MFNKDAGALENKVSQRESEIDWQIKLADILTIYLGEKCIDEYKKDKMTMYRQILQRFHATEIANNHKIATFWAKMLNDGNVKQSTKAAEWVTYV